MNQDSKHFKLFAECRLVQGAKRSAIYDLPRNTYKLIPNGLYDLIRSYEGASIEQVKKEYSQEDHPVLDEYFKMLHEDEYIFFCDEDEVDLFPEMEAQWDYPGAISNAVIEWPDDIKTLTKILTELENLGCRQIQFRSFDVISIKEITAVLAWLSTRDIDHIEIVSKSPDSDMQEAAKEIFEKNPRLRVWFLHSAPQTHLTRIGDSRRQNLVSTTEAKKVHSDFFQNGTNYFNVNIELFFESQLFNTYYNRKVSVSKTGEIKNCLALDKTYGNTATHKLEDIVKSDGFRELWYARKDEIASCNMCEFRHMCVDNSPLRSENGQWVKQKECFYDPYSATFKK